MEIEFIRNIRTSYMKIGTDTEFGELEKRMLEANQIPGLLAFTTKREDERYCYYYAISGKLSLDVLLENENADCQRIMLLLTGICSVIEKLDSYLLNLDGLYLTPEGIFFDYKSEEFSFCYVPRNDVPITDNFKKLIEFLLKKTEHKDYKAVELVYGIYDEMTKPGYHIGAVRKWIVEAGKEGKNREWRREQEIPEAAPEEDIPINREKEDCSPFRVKLRKLLGGILEKRKRQADPRSMAQGRVQQYVFEPEEEEEAKCSRPTILLAERKSRPQGILKYEGINGHADIKISKSPFLIGSSTECDAVIAEGTVSRQHARVTRTDEIYFVEDLNSSNGTKVGGEILPYKVKASLSVNDTVEFSDEVYRFL